MKLIKWLLVIVVGLVIIFLAGAYALPRSVTVERTAVIAAAPEQVFPYVNSMQRTEEWSPWLSLDPNTKLTYSGPEEGVGNRLEWSSDHESVGSGTQEITASVPNEHVETALDFGPMGTATAYFNLEEKGDGTEVTWGLVSNLGNNPIARWMGLMLDRWVGADYEKGLANLTAVAERQ